jgi:hypothetical protein
LWKFDYEIYKTPIMAHGGFMKPVEETFEEPKPPRSPEVSVHAKKVLERDRLNR